MSPTKSRPSLANKFCPSRTCLTPLTESHKTGYNTCLLSGERNAMLEKPSVNVYTDNRYLGVSFIVYHMLRGQPIPMKTNDNRRGLPHLAQTLSRRPLFLQKHGVLHLNNASVIFAK
jgi:hypothetical protein